MGAHRSSLRGQRRLEDQLVEPGAPEPGARERIDERVGAGVEPPPNEERAVYGGRERAGGEQVGGDGRNLGARADVGHSAAEDPRTLGATDAAGAFGGLGQRREARAARAGKRS